MIKYFWGILLTVFALISCKRDDDSLQRIDQMLNIYMRNSNGQDLLNSKKTGSFIGYSVNDLLGVKENSPVSIPLKMTTDSLYYMEYFAGAKRRRLDSIGTENPGTKNIYCSKMRITFIKNTHPNENITGILEIHYRNTPKVFQVSKVFYDGNEVFSKEADAPTSINTVTIIK